MQNILLQKLLRRMAVPRNIIILLTDEERYPPSYETEEIKKWRETNLLAREEIKKHGVEFHNHYTSATACTPSRASIFLGHYPSLHGCSRTGAGTGGKNAFRTWLNAENFPTMGHYFKAAGYSTHYIGKWHLSEEDLHDEKGNIINSSKYGKSIPENENLYQSKYLLKKFGWDNPWIGPEPHGIQTSNFGLYRDGLYVAQAIKELNELSKTPEKPFIMVISLVNPHDIGALPAYYKYYMGGTIDDKNLPKIPIPPNFIDNKTEKPSTLVKSYKAIANMLGGNGVLNWNRYRRFYYYLHKEIDNHILTLLNSMKELNIEENSILVFSSDHGDLVSSHNGGIQKFYNAYEESIHIPLVFHCPSIFNKETENIHNFLTSGVDLLPTILNLVGLDINELYLILENNYKDEFHPNGFNEVPKLIGNDFSSKILSFSKLNEIQLKNKEKFELVSKNQGCQAIYFMTEDEVTKSFNYFNVVGESIPELNFFYHNQFDCLRGACHVEAVICYFPNRNEIYKFVRFWENPKLWTHPNEKDVIYKMVGADRGKCVIVTEPAQDEYELYNITNDPIELYNLYHNDDYIEICEEMKNLLIKIRCEKRIEPSSDLVKLSLPDYKNGLTIPPKVSWSPFVKLCFMLGTFGYSYYLFSSSK